MKKSKRSTTEKASTESASRKIDTIIRQVSDWRGETLARVRTLIREADPEVVEEVKWVKPTNPNGVPVWSHDGILCTGEVYKEVVKLTFARGASLDDPQGLFNSSLDGNTRRAIDIREKETLNVRAFKALIKAAVAQNAATSNAKPKPTPEKTAKPEAAGKTRRNAHQAGPMKAGKPNKDGVVLLSGGNPQIAKADGDAPVRAYIAAIPGWKRDIGKRLDELIVRNAPTVRKAVKWNSPFYGIEGQGWFASFHVFTRYVKLTFFKGTSLRPIPAGGTAEEARWIDIHEDDLDEAQVAAWVKQAAALPGWSP
jgi:hypothetical protein